MAYLPIFESRIVRAAIRASTLKHYVYILCRPDGQPFYVGKGVDDRVFCHEAEARNLPTKSHKLNVIRAIYRSRLQVGYHIDNFFEDEKAALERERELIASIGRHDLRIGPLTNQTDGGEGASNPSLESRQRRAATLGGLAQDPDRRAINEFFNSIGGQQDSVPIKPLGTRKLVPLTPHPSPRQPTVRMAKTLVAAASASEILLSAGCVLPRVFSMEDRPYAIENGVGRDMLKAGLIKLSSAGAKPEDELVELTLAGFDYIQISIGPDRLLDLGVLEPKSEFYPTN